MKKLVVALLIVAMLVSAFVICMPMDASAEESTVGATITTTWTGDHKTEAEIEAETGKSFTPITSYDEFAAIANGSAEELAYYCLILPEETETFALTGTAHVRKKDVSYVYIDFNGYSVDVTGDNNAVFGSISNATIKNLKIVGDLRSVSADAYYSAKKNVVCVSPLTANGYGSSNATYPANGHNGVVHLDNVVSEVNFTVHQEHAGGKYMGGIIGDVASGSTFNNCVYNGTIIAENDATGMAADAAVLACQTGYFGGIVGYAGYNTSGTITFNNCLSQGSMTFEADIRLGTSGNGGAAMGGIVGYSDDLCEFTDCKNEMDITVNAFAWTSASDSTLKSGHVGGIIGQTATTAPDISNCTNTGDIKVTAGHYNVGGILGYTTVATTITDSSNGGAITTTTASTSSHYIGGILGYAYPNNTATVIKLDGCVNSGAITAEQNIYHVGGVAGGAYKANFQVVDCENTATGVVTYFVSGGTMRGVGGIVGYSNESIFSISGCTNRGSVTQTTSGTAPQNVFIGGIVGRLYTNKQSATVENCTNEGVITGTQNATSANSGVGGVLGTLQSGGEGSSLSISGCTNNASGSISGRNAGGIMGTCYINDATCSLTITDSKNYAPVDAKYNAGGILGNRSGSGASSGLSLTGCTNEGAVSSDNHAGGVVGYVLDNATVSTCVNRGSVTVVYSGTFTKDVTGATENYSASAVVRAGGIVGYAKDGLTLEISSCDNYGGVSATGTASGTLTTLTTDAAAELEEGTEPMTATFSFSVDAGGIIPVADGALTITDCNTYNSASLIKASLTNSVSKVGGYATVTSTPETAGGIVGRIVVAPTFSGNMTTANSANADYAGGVAGYTDLELTLDGFTNSGNMTATYAGGILGYTTNNLTVTNCTNLGNITSSGHSAGGIVSFVGKTLTISGCTNGQKDTSKAAVTQGTGHDNGGLGGIVGRVNVNLIMEGCTNYGPVNTAETYGAVAKYVGGMVGRVKQSAYIGYAVATAATAERVAGEPCYNYGDIDLKHVFNNSNTEYLGGIIGESVIELYMTGCYNYGDITVNASIDNSSSRSGVGGIVGVPFDNAASVVYIGNCENHGDIIYTCSTVYTNVANSWGAGGIIGRIFSNKDPKVSVTVENCENHGDIYSTTDIQFLYAGGIVGYQQGNTISLSYCENYGDITSWNFSAGIIAYGCNGPVIDHCISDATITATGNSGLATNYIGGIIGRGYSSPSITNCTISGKLDIKDWTSTADAYVGGVAGHCAGGTITGCTNNADISIVNGKILGGVGGILGRTNAGMTFTDNTNNGNISIDATSVFKISDNNYGNGIGGLMGNGLGTHLQRCHNTGDITIYTETSVGGIVGLNSSGQTVLTFTGCTNSGDITVITDVAAERGVGGIIGYCYTAGLTFTSCENSGDITGQHFLGGIIGKSSKDVTLIDCENSGVISDTMLAGYAVGGLVGYSSGITVTRCINDGPINSTGIHTGGLVGRAAGAKVFTDCENTVNGVITFMEMTSLNTMTGVGGILGYADETPDDVIATFTYCVNNGVIKSSDVATGFKTYMGGIVGRAANPCEFAFNYCANNGDITAAAVNVSHAGGILGLHQAYTNAEVDASEYSITNCVNTGSVTAYRTGGIVGTLEVGHDTAPSYTAITITNCINTGDIDAVSYGAGIVGFNSSKIAAETLTKITYYVQDCANLGKISGKNISGIVGCANTAAMNISNCISAGEFDPTGTGETNLIAPTVTGDYDQYTDTVTGCVFLAGLNVGNGALNAYGATEKSADEIKDLLRGLDATYVVYDKLNLNLLYQVALDRADKTGLEDAMEAVRQIIERNKVEAGERNFFTTTQYAADQAYDTLYALLYPANFESAFQVYLPVSITLSEGLDFTANLSDFTPEASLAIVVTQDGIANGQNFKLYLVGDNSKFLEFCFVGAEDAEFKGGATLATLDLASASKNGGDAYHFDTEIKVDGTVPGRYNGTLTFTVNYDDGK